MYGEIVTVEDIGPLLATVGVDMPLELDHEELAQALNRLAIDFVLTTRASTTATPGEIAAFFRAWEKQIIAVLEPVQRDPHPPAAVERLGHLLRGDQANAWDDLLPDAIPRLARWIDETAFWRGRVNLIQTHFEVRKGAKREAPAIELAFFERLAEIFETSFGRRISPSMGGSPGQGGPGVRFVLAILKRISERLPVAELGMDDPVPAVLERLSKPATVADRIRDAIGGKPRKR